MLLDLQLGDADGFDLLAELRAAYPALPVVVVSASDRTSDVIRAIDVGAMGFVPKRASNETLFEALRMVMSGGIYVPPMTLGLGARRAEHPRATPCPSVLRAGRRDERAATAAFQHQRRCRSPTLGLTPRQTDVLALLLQGQAQQADRARAEPVGRDGQGPRRRGAARARRQSRTQAVLAVSQMTAARRGARLARQRADRRRLSAAPAAASGAAATAARRAAAAGTRRPDRRRRPRPGRRRRVEHPRTYAYMPATLAGYLVGIGVVAVLFWSHRAGRACCCLARRCSCCCARCAASDLRFRARHADRAATDCCAGARSWRVGTLVARARCGALAVWLF